MKGGGNIWNEGFFSIIYCRKQREGVREKGKMEGMENSFDKGRDNEWAFI